MRAEGQPPPQLRLPRAQGAEAAQQHGSWTGPQCEGRRDTGRKTPRKGGPGQTDRRVRWGAGSSAAPRRELVDGAGRVWVSRRAPTSPRQPGWSRKQIPALPPENATLRSQMARTSPQSSLVPAGVSENSPAPPCLPFLYMKGQVLSKALERRMGVMAQH